MGSHFHALSPLACSSNEFINSDLGSKQTDPLSPFFLVPLGRLCCLYFPKGFPVSTVTRVLPLRRHLLSGLAENNRAAQLEGLVSHHRVTDYCPAGIGLPALPLICLAITIEGVSRIVLARLI